MEGFEFITGPRKGERVEIDREMVAGREADLRLEDDEVSRRHTSLRPGNGGI